ncbi:hypothetical protein IQ260_16295 [Leptolyngbya cf. ectocarpi LEGE 11479]|uniref:Uncharacterized protein n=1 Tax=Leptolyngbya cf. ectocarpi LEGE 11479 TaxID=1828722 RepID=A0A929FA53_LEPEC|nr:hypothetical protein [Leptolyngbya ectocarpi]MBE9068212.1 hypothetical protein [Leptolyngbya cf. ectocarpi LEGE 11479]
MQFWAVGVVCLYVGIGLFNWVTGLHWLAEFSLPMSILGGIGLAIASNANSPRLPAASPSTDSLDDATPPDSAGPPPQTVKAASQSIPESSISFTIHKNVRP